MNPRAALVAALFFLAAPFFSSAAHADAPRVSPRKLCGCPTPRLLRDKAAPQDARTWAWLHDDARLGVFKNEAADGAPPQLMETADAVLLRPFRFSDVDAPFFASSDAFDASGTLWLGVLKKNDKVPRDLVRLPKVQPTTTTPAAPSLRALWLAPLELQERAGCGAYLTHRLAIEPDAKAADVEAFWVRDRVSGQSALIDARQALTYGIGRIDVCEQGLPLQEGQQAQLEVRPVSSHAGVGAPWLFRSDGRGQDELVRTEVPADADESRSKEPFPVPGADDNKGPTYKDLIFLALSTLVVVVVVFAFFVWVVIPARKRSMKDFPCPSCGARVPFDALDPDTDGFFCPACGASGFWKGRAGKSVGATVLRPEQKQGDAPSQVESAPPSAHDKP